MHILKTNKKNIMFSMLRLRNILLHSMNCSVSLLIISPSISHRSNAILELTLLINIFLYLFCLSFCVNHFASHFSFNWKHTVGINLSLFFLYLYWKFIQPIATIHFSFLLPKVFNYMTTSQCSYVSY